MITKIRVTRKGSILIFALWALGLLAVLSLALGNPVRQKIRLLSRIEKRDVLFDFARSGARKAMAILQKDWDAHGRQLCAASKMVRHNNPAELAGLDLGEGESAVFFYQFSVGAVDPSPVPPAGPLGPEQGGRTEQSQGVDTKPSYGMMDEESKINLNKASLTVIRRLLEQVLGSSGQELDELAVSIVDWRKKGSSELAGFYSDEYYANLRDPYPVKDSDYEILEELQLVRGASPEIFSRLSPYVTVYGDGKVNVNTATPPVLLALGLDPSVVDMILKVRRGNDGMEATADDFIFCRTYDIVSDIKSQLKLKGKEAALLDQLEGQEFLGTESSFFFIQSEGRFKDATEVGRVHCIYDASSRRVVYWQEDLQSASEVNYGMLER